MSFLINPHRLAPPPDAATREYRATKTLTGLNTSTITWTACDIGAPASGRYVVFAAALALINNRTVTAATVGGVAARINKQAGNTYGGSVRIVTVIGSALLEAGSTADIDFTLSGGSGSPSSARVATYRTLGLQSNVEVDTDEHLSTSGLTKTLNLDVNDGGLLFATGFAKSSSFPTFTGVTRDYFFDLGSDSRFAGGSEEITADETDRAVVATITGSNPFGNFIAASFR